MNDFIPYLNQFKLIQLLFKFQQKFKSCMKSFILSLHPRAPMFALP